MATVTNLDQGIFQNYFRKARLNIVVIAFLAIVCVVEIGLSITVSGLNVSFSEVYNIIYNHITGNVMDKASDYIVVNLNLPRAIFAILTGFGLAVAGVAMQNVMKNPLAEPYTTGISSGACLGMAAAISLGFSMSYTIDNLAILILTFMMSMIPTSLVILLLPKRNTSPATIILVGVSLSYLFNAMNTTLLLFTEAETLAGIYNWQIGSFASIKWNSIAPVLIVTMIGTISLWLMSRKLNILSLGNEEAVSLGVDAESYRLAILIILSLMVSVIVAYAGIIGFVGLVAPHIVRAFTGSDNRYLIPMSAFLGAAFVLFCDIVCRLINDTFLPAGVMISLIGAPFFIMAVVKSKNMW